MATGKNTKKTTYENRNVGLDADNLMVRGRTSQKETGNITTRKETRLNTGVQSASRTNSKSGVDFYRSKSEGEKQVSGRVRSTKSAAQIKAQMERIKANAANSGLSSKVVEQALNAGKAIQGYRSLGAG